MEGLEQKLVTLKRPRETTIDVYASGLVKMYSGPNYNPGGGGCGMPGVYQPMNHPTLGQGPLGMERQTTLNEYFKPKPIGTVSDFKFGSSPHSVEEDSSGFKFRYRAGEHEEFGRDHINYETISPLGRTEIFKPKFNILDNQHL